jgi:hypothetical protein
MSVRQVGLRAATPLAKARTPFPAGASDVIGIYSIAIFLIVIAALNFYEFGRLD